MAIFKLRNSNGQIRQLNLSDIFGELSASRNIDLFTKRGKLKLARPFRQVAAAADISNNRIEGFASIVTSSETNRLFALTANTLYTALNPFTSWTSETSSPSRAEDCTVFKGELIISGANNLDAYDFSSTYTSGWWTARGNPSLTDNNPVSQVPRVIETAHIGTETLVVLDGSEIHAYSGGITGSPVNSVTMDIDSALTASCFKSGVRTGWIGTYTRKGEEAYVIQWDCASTNYTQAYPVGAKAVLAIEIVDDAPLIVTDTGEIKLFNNAGFTTIAQFPFTTKPKFLDNSTNPNNRSRPIHPKGMKRRGDVVYIYTNFINLDSSDFFDHQTPNGLWALDLNTRSLTHLGSPENDVVFGTLGASPLFLVDDHDGRFLVGADRLNDLTSSEEGIWMEDLDDDSANYGYFVTSEIEPENVSDTIGKIYSKALLGSNDEIVVKYRTSSEVNYPVEVIGCFWLDTTTFTTTEDLSAVKTRFDAGNYDEVEILSGSGAGRLAHITALTKSASTYQITVDEAIGTAAGEFYARFDNWEKINKPMTASDGELKQIGAGAENCTWFQFKVELRGKAGRPEFRQFAIKSNSKETY